MPTQFVWAGFLLLVFALLALDLGVFQRKAHEIQFKEALALSAFWVTLAVLFNLGIFIWRGSHSAMEFLAGYLVEESLSVDNLFVFLIIFKYFHVPGKYQHGVLFWGILGALVMRGFFIAAGISLLDRFQWLIYVFGGFLVFTAIRLWREKEQEIHPERNLMLKAVRRIMPVTNDYHEGKFFVRRAGRWLATPLFVVLLIVETTDIVFAVDSIPAILAITRDPFIVYTSNVFAILGLRSLYFALAGLMQLFHHLHYGLAFVLAFVGVKMLLSHVVHIPIAVSLGVIAATLGLSIAASLKWPQRVHPPVQHSH